MNPNSPTKPRVGFEPASPRSYFRRLDSPGDMRTKMVCQLNKF